MNKTIIAVLFIAVIIFGGYFFLRGSDRSNTPSSPEIIANSQALNQERASQSSNSGQLNEEVSSQSSAGQVKFGAERIVIYNEAGYSPESISIKNGETVIFKNNSSRSMWPASAMHPSHRVYPTTGGCLGSTFDACNGVQPGRDWSFKFDIVGAWKYHDHLHPADRGIIVVE